MFVNLNIGWLKAIQRPCPTTTPERCHDRKTIVLYIVRKWRWVGHVLKKGQHNITRESISWMADGNRKRGMPNTT